MKSADALLALSLFVFCASCSITPYQRTLPEHVKRVYIPMAENKTFEPGLEEMITNAFQTELLADGRLEIANKSKADTIAKIVLNDFKGKSKDFENDAVESQREMTIDVSLQLFYPEDLKNPFARVKSFPVVLSYKSDYRSYYSELDVDAKQRLAETVGLRMVNALMNEAKLTK